MILYLQVFMVLFLTVVGLFFGGINLLTVIFSALIIIFLIWAIIDYHRGKINILKEAANEQ